MLVLAGAYGDKDNNRIVSLVISLVVLAFFFVSVPAQLSFFFFCGTGV
jgi:hypothetical protein